MTRLLYFFFSAFALVKWSDGVSTKMDFGEEEILASVTNSTNVNDEDVEVQHTIVLSTKLRNNNRKAIHSSNDGDSGTLTYKIGARQPKEDSGEVPIINGYKSVETTQIRTPDTRNRGRPDTTHPIYLDSTFSNRNIRDELDVYPNYIINPSQWKPSTLYNNINWLSQELPSTEYNSGWKVSRPAYQTPGKFHRRISDDGVQEFYCRKCRELGGEDRSCSQQAQRRNNINKYNPWQFETTTPKIKLDGKLAKLN